MQLASRGVSRLVNHGIQPKLSRGIHIPTFVRTTPKNIGSETIRKVLQQSRTLVGQFFTHLTTPGTLRGSSQSLLTRPIHFATRSHNAIQNGLSLHARTVLSRPLRPPFLPRPPTIPRGTTQVGLGTARNFSSARPIFQNLAQNVPITGRAFWEADWELKVREERERMMPKRLKKQKQIKGDQRKEMMKQKPERVTVLDKPNQVQPTTQLEDRAEIDHYFPAPIVPEVSTYLLIPLAPTPTSRLPLHALPPDHRALLPLSALASVHALHATHSLRVSSLFARLDTADVWSRGVTCTAYSHGSAVKDGEGACTILKVEFVGWTKAEVRGVIGESGTGWCVLEECRAESEDDDTSSIFSGTSCEIEDFTHSGTHSPMPSIDPAQSFIIPTLDFSSYSASNISAADLDFSDSEWDALSQSSGSSDAGGTRSKVGRTDSSSHRFAFSSDFTSKTSAISDEEPKEYLF